MKALALAMLLVAATLVVVPTAAAGPFECYDIYSEHTVGPVTVIQRSSCSYEVCFESEDGSCGSILR